MCHQQILVTKESSLLFMQCTLAGKRRHIIDFSNKNKERQASDNREGDSNSGTDDEDDNDGKTRASVTSSRQSNGNSRAMSVILNSIQKSPPAATLPPPITVPEGCEKQ